MAGNRKSFSITWRIENYNFFFERPGRGFDSPSFTIGSVEQTSWKCRIVANSVKKKGHLVFCVRKESTPVVEIDVEDDEDIDDEEIHYEDTDDEDIDEDDIDDEDIDDEDIDDEDIDDEDIDNKDGLEMDFEISFFSEDNYFPSFENSYVHSFSKDQETLKCFIPHQKVYSTKENEYIPVKTLTIRCIMFLRNGSFPEAGQCFARTRIRVERTAFTGFTEKFSSLMPGESKDVTIKSASEKKPHFNMKLSLGGYLCCKEKVWIEIIPVNKNYIKFCNCKLYLFNSEGQKIECGRSEILFTLKESQDWKFPLNFTKDYLMKKNAQFSSEDILVLKFEFAFSTGVEYEKIEDSEFGENGILNKNKSHQFPSALEDMTRLFKEGLFCDMKLRTKTETFNVHKNILSARSSVFKSMFSTDMKEKTMDCVDIKDLNADTVRQMLLFLYSDTLEDLGWASSKNLFYAADKYNIMALKHKCSGFLKHALQPSNCCEILKLSDSHHDGDLKKSVQEFICHNRDSILNTDLWVNLEKSDPVLVIETLRIMCLEN